MKGGRGGGGRDDGWAHVAMNGGKRLATFGSNRQICSRSSSSLRLSLRIRPCVPPVYLNPAIGQKELPNMEAQ